MEIMEIMSQDLFSSFLIYAHQMENVTHSKLILKLLAFSSFYLPPKKSYFVSCKANPTTDLL